MSSAPRYLFLQRDSGSAIFTVDTEPTAADHESVRFHLLEIVRLPDLARLSPEGQWLPIGEGTLVGPENLGTDDPPMHVGYVPAE
jgi:hypothetical protein